MIAKLTLCCSVLFVFLAGPSAVAQTGEGGPPPPRPARKIPGINAEDRFPHACVDCHIDYVEMKMDTRFSTMMKQWSEKVSPSLLEKAQAAAPEGVTLRGRHPAMPGLLSNIPAKCLPCHGKSSKTAPPFAKLMHLIHLTGDEENHFMTVFQGECTDCHKLDLPSGEWSIPSAPEREK